ncbi:hypothetical protein [Pontibacter oryzae]|uniref:Type 1 periplasmic binding fold superfamily protein n=1 Tax=Pontibacter oryzae TaxID=2304593 RepID=A0A399S418_9BACT|nr:hypothetical protein [Pontibacter oryzae]RIJ37484.1 hypothetical protein D1627_10225 [Pontibacter oryzae]
MKKLFRPYLSAFLLGSLLVSATACKDSDDPEPLDDEELITTMTVTLVPEGKGGTVIATFTDPDGDGGAAPTIETMALKPNTTYNATITIADDSPNGAGDITSEIRTEGNDHELFWVANPSNLLTAQKIDKDANNRPLGLAATVTTTNAGSGTLTITLKHQPGLKGATSDANKGETDIMAAFPVSIQE